jgi:hypothetical protein
MIKLQKSDRVTTEVAKHAHIQEARNSSVEHLGCAFFCGRYLASS